MSELTKIELAQKIEQELDKRISLANDLIIKAGEVTLTYFRSTHNKIEIKGDDSLVSLADKATQKLITQEIGKLFPNDSIYAEESCNPYTDIKHDNIDKFEWVIDPIDGTTAFLAGKPSFTILIGITYQNIPLFGIVYQPYSKELWQAKTPNILQILADTKATSTYHENTNLQELLSFIHSKTQATKSCIVATTSDEYLNDSGRKIYNELSRYAKKSYGGDAYNYMMLCEGNIKIVYEQGLKYFDYIPLIPILLSCNAEIYATIDKPLGEECLKLNSKIGNYPLIMPDLLVISNKI